MPAPDTKTTILVVDDDPGVLGSLRFLLETEGFDVKTFRSGGALLRSLDVALCDCFVIDYKLDDMSGLDLTSKLRERRIGAPIILITGYPDEEIMTKATLAGAREVLLKPHLEDSLVADVRAAVQEWRNPSASA
ncbi:MAG: response regulator [Xanthobacteraceae bacterium]|nr:response regulator [Xanthobacteraceae bacterium]